MKIPDALYESLAPFLSGLSLFDINALLYHLSSDTVEDFDMFMDTTNSVKLKLICEINKEEIRDYLSCS